MMPALNLYACSVAHLFLLNAWLCFKGISVRRGPSSPIYLKRLVYTLKMVKLATSTPHQGHLAAASLFFLLERAKVIFDFKGGRKGLM
jgi:hypothetical protein